MTRILFIFTCLFIQQIALGNDEELIQKQFVEFFSQNPLIELSAERDLQTIGSDGTWTDIEYSSKRRGNWPTRIHLDRLVSMAAVYADPATRLYRNQNLKKAVLNGLDHWIEKDYRNPNWYNERIGVPYRLASVLMLMGEDIPQKLTGEARSILYRSKLGMTGQNKVWCAGIGIMKGVLYQDSKLLQRAVKDIWSELKVTIDEGIQPDWSFHQHGPQQQFGNYGNSFGNDMVLWASVMRGTSHALAGDSLKVLRNYFLEGPSWILWQGRMDLSGCGRHLDEDCQQSKAQSIVLQLEKMKAIDSEFRNEYQLRIDSSSSTPDYENTGKLTAGSNSLLGYKPFWRSDMGVHRRPDWYASVKMSSTRVVGSESCNSENVLGLHLGDGVLMTHLSGTEYENIIPLWDWKRLPGTTCDQGLNELTPPTLEGYGGTEFSGVVSDGETGIATMIYKRGELMARKSWFFFEDHIVCLGSGIGGNTTGSVITSVDQSWLRGEVKEKDGWVWHNKIGYQFLTGNGEFSMKEVDGNWLSSFPTRGDRPTSGKVFSLWIDHGNSPQNDLYAYKVIPGMRAEEMEDVPGDELSQLLKNCSTVQAVENEGVIYAVFYEPDELQTKNAGVIEVSAPCVLILKDREMIAVDPLHRLKSLDINIDGSKSCVSFPQGKERGKQIQLQSDTSRMHW